MVLVKSLLFLCLVVAVIACGCTSTTNEVPQTTSPTPTPAVITQVITAVETTITPTPTPEPTNDARVCYDRNLTTYPQYCYDMFYWVKPTTTPVDAGYQARVWKNDSCVKFNITSQLCEEYGDGSYTVLALHNLTQVRNVSGINNTEAVAMVTYYNKTFDLNRVAYPTAKEYLDFGGFIDAVWDGTYPATKYDTSLFAPDPNVVIPVVNGTFNPEGF